MINRSNLVHTYSIVARDAATGDLGVAVQSHWFSVGSGVTWARAGVGAIATQALANFSFGPRGLDLLAGGRSAHEAVEELIRSDKGSAYRQLAIVDAAGRVATHTGANCIEAAGHHVGDGYSVQANMMLNDAIWPAMANAFESSAGPLPERLVAALVAAQAAGGDVRGKQSAALLVVRGESTGKPWEDTLVELRVEDHPTPVEELSRLLRVARAYEDMNAGDAALEAGDTAGALAAYSAARAVLGDNPEPTYWHAIALANIGRVDESLSLFQEVFDQDANWAVLTERLRPAGLLSIDDDDLARIMRLIA